MKQEVDETTGQEAMVIIEHKEDLHPQIIIVDDKGEAARQLLRFLPARTSSSNEGDKIVAGTLHGQDAAQDVEDQGHHRRSAACGRVVRSSPSEGRRRDLEDRRHRRLRRRASAASACIVIKDPQTGVGRGTPHPDRQARHRLQGRLREERPAAHRRSDRPARNSRHLRTAGTCRSISSTKCRKFIACRA